MKFLDKMLKELNKQYAEELASAYLYLHMSLWANEQDLPGLTAWMHKQAVEEMGHAKKIYDYILERNGQVVLETLKKPEGKWSSMLDLMKASLAHEEYISARMLKLTELGATEKDYATVEFLHWFLAEQVEEEAHAAFWVKRLEKCGDNIGALMIVDGEMAQR